MATIIEGGGVWTLTEAAAEHLVEEEIVFKCNANHKVALEVDKPIYHLKTKYRDDPGIQNLHSLIVAAEEAVGK